MSLLIYRAFAHSYINAFRYMPVDADIDYNDLGEGRHISEFNWELSGLERDVEIFILLTESIKTSRAQFD